MLPDDLAGAQNMKDLLPVFVVLFVLVLITAGVVAGVVWWTSGTPNQTVGTVLIYELDPQPGDDSVSVDMEALLAAIDSRVNPGWSSRARLRRLGGRRLEIGVFGEDPETVQRVQRLLGHRGQLELRVLANKVDHQPLIQQANNQGGDALRNPAGDVLARWVPVATGHDPALQDPSEFATRTSIRDGREILEVLAIEDVFNVTNEHLQQALPAMHDGQPCVKFVLNEEGAQLFGQLTADSLPSLPPGFPVSEGFTGRLGIILDGRLCSTLAVRTAVYDQAVIAGSFTREEARDLAEVLNADPLPVAITLVGKLSGDVPR